MDRNLVLCFSYYKDTERYDHFFDYFIAQLKSLTSMALLEDLEASLDKLYGKGAEGAQSFFDAVAKHKSAEIKAASGGSPTP